MVLKPGSDQNGNYLSKMRNLASLRGTQHEFFMEKTHAQSAAPKGQHRDVICNFLKGAANVQEIAALPLAMTQFCAFSCLSKCHSGLTTES